jgi:hypothetical protein
MLFLPTGIGNISLSSFRMYLAPADVAQSARRSPAGYLMRLSSAGGSDAVAHGFPRTGCALLSSGPCWRLPRRSRAVSQPHTSRAAPDSRSTSSRSS